MKIDSRLATTDKFLISARTVFVPLIFLLIAQEFLLRDGSILKMAIVFPLLAIFPAFFVFSLIAPGNKFEDSVLPAVLVGPVVSCSIGVGAMYAKVSIGAAVLSIYALAIVAGAIVAVRGGNYESDRPNSRWAYPTIFTLVVTALVAAPILSTLRMRALHDGWFHIAAAWRIMNFGVPPEDPLYPGEGIHNYWFYHAWGALVSRATGRSPADAYSLINIHAIIAVVLGTWKLTGLLSDRPAFRKIALFIAVLGMNATGWIYFLLHKSLAFLELFKSRKPNLFFGYINLFGDYRVPYFLVKFVPPNAFPIGIQLFVAGLLAATVVVSEPKRRDWAAVLFLAAFGAMLFHPTSGMGLYAGVGMGLLAIVVSDRTLKKLPWLPIIIMGAAGILSLPYLFSVFPAKSEKMSVAVWWFNAWCLMQLYVLSYQLLIRGTKNAIRMRTPSRVFTLGGLVGIVASALFIMLPGQNQYKFIQLAAVPVGLVAACSFLEPSNMRWKRIALWALVLSVLATTGLLARFYLTSDWSRKEMYAYAGNHIYPLSSKNNEDKNFFEWVWQATPKDAILVDWYNQFDAVLCSERTVMTSLDVWVSKGHTEQAMRMELVKGLFANSDPIRKETTDYLRKLGRPVYIVYPPVLLEKTNILSRFTTDTARFEPVYNRDDYRVFKLK